MVDPKKLLLKNILSNWMAMFVSISIAFFMSPFLVNHLGKERYGIWALVLSVVAYTNLLDAGMKQGLAKFIPKYYALKDYRSLNEIMSTSNFIYVISGSLVIPFVLAITFIFIDAFNVAAGLIPTMQIVLLIIGARQVAIFYFMSRTALGPFHRYDLGTAIDMSFDIIRAVMIFIFISRGYGLVTLAVLTITFTFFKFTLRAITLQRIVPQLKYKIKYIKKSRFKEIFGYSIVSFFIVITWMVIFSSNNIIIGVFLTTTDVTYFSIAGTLINYLRTLINAVGIPLVPAISHFDASSDHEEIARLYTKLSRYLYYLTSCIAAGVMFFGGKFINLWMGEGFQSTINVMYILIIPAAIYLPQVAANSVLLGISKHKTLLYILIVEAIIKIGLSVTLVHFMGIYGVAIGTAVPQFIIYLFVYPYIFSKIIGLSLKSYYLTNLIMAVTASVFVIPVSLLLRQVNMLVGWPGLIVDVVVFGIFALAGFWFRILSDEDRKSMRARFGI